MPSDTHGDNRDDKELSGAQIAAIVAAAFFQGIADGIDDARPWIRLLDWMLVAALTITFLAAMSIILQAL